MSEEEKRNVALEVFGDENYEDFLEVLSLHDEMSLEFRRRTEGELPFNPIAPERRRFARGEPQEEVAHQTSEWRPSGGALDMPEERGRTWGATPDVPDTEEREGVSEWKPNMS